MSLADSQIHIIATMRGKDAYEMEKSEVGKLNVKKIGIGAKQREGFEYEFTVTFLLDQKSYMAEVQKDNTHIFEGGTALLSETHGEKIIEWANSGSGFTVPLRETKLSENLDDKDLEELKKMTVEKCKELGGANNERLMEILKTYVPNGNPNSIKNIEKLRQLYAEISTL